MADGNGLNLNVASFFSATGNPASDISRPYLFRIELPQFIEDGATNYSSQGRISAFARTTTLPEYKISDIDIPYAGMTYRMGGVADFSGSWDITFLLDESHILRQQLLLWQQRAHNPNNLQSFGPGNYKANVSYSDTGAGSVKVYQLAKDSSVVSTYNFVGIFPRDVQAVELNTDTADSPEEMTVTFSYDYFTARVGDSQDAPTTKGSERTFDGVPFTFGGFGGDAGVNG